MSKYYIMLKTPDEAVVDLTKICGTIEFIPTPDGKTCEELLKTGNFNIAPVLCGRKAENGQVTFDKDEDGFEIFGFSLIERKKEKI